MCPIAPLCDGSKRPGSRSRRLPGLTRGESYEEVLATLQCSLSLFGSTHPAFDHRGDTLALSLPQATIGADAMGSQDFKTRVVERAVLIDLFLRCGLLVAGTRRARMDRVRLASTLWPYPEAGLCLRKPSLIACLIPSSIKVLAASGTLVPWVPSLDSWSKYSQVARASVIGRRSVSAMPNCTMAGLGIRVLFDSKKSRNRFTFR